MANGKRRANGEKVLEERLAAEMELMSELNLNRLSEITDLYKEVAFLKSEVKAMKERSNRAANVIAATVASVILVALLAVLK